MTAPRCAIQKFSFPTGARLLSACLILLAGLVFPATLPAQAPLREQTSLKFIPDDAAFYGSSLRLKQQLENFTRSKAFARLAEVSFVKEAVEEVKKRWAEEGQASGVEKATDKPADKPADKTTQKKAKPAQAPADAAAEDADEDESDAPLTDADWNEAIRELKAFWSDPDNQKLVTLSLDALSHEIFFYGDSSIVGFIKELQKINVDVSSLVTGGMDDATDVSPDHPMVKAFLDGLENLPVPAFVVGLKLSDQAGAQTQLARLEQAIRAALQDFPDLAQALGRQKIGPGEFLTFKLDGSKIPWDALIDAATEADKPDDDGQDDDAKKGDDKQPADDAKDDDEPDDTMSSLTPEQTRALIKAFAAKLNRRSLTISLGLYDGYLLFSFGEKNAHLLKFSGKGRRLIDRPELAPLLKFADKPLTGIDYVSAELSSMIQNSSDGVDALDTFLEQWGDTIGVAEEARAQLVEDVKGLAADAAKRRASPGATLRWQYLTPRGYEGYSYDFGGGDKSFDGSKKLTILDHVGSDPLIVVAARHKGQIEGYQFLAKCLAVAAPHLDGILTTHLEDLLGGEYSQFKTEFSPILEKFHSITQKQLLPALADGQSAFVLDAKTITALLAAVLPASEPLPIPAPALVYGVKDAALLKQAGSGYFALLQETAESLSRMFPDQVPAIVLPPPVERDAPGGELYVYAIPGSEAGKDEVALTGAVGTNIAVLSLFPAQARCFLAKTKFQPAGVLARSDQPAARVWYVNVAGLIGMIEPWLNYGFEMSAAIVQPQDAGEAWQSVKTIIEVVKCWRRSAGIQYHDKGALVEYSESIFEDLK